MSFNGLRVKDEKYLTRKLISEMPTKLVSREFIQNTMECEKVTKVCIGDIEVDGFNTKKFYIINDGMGMSLDKIKDLQDIFGSDKNPNRDINGNNNTGARLISLRTNMLGTIFISKCDGKINGCLIKRDENFNVDFRLINTKRKQSDKYVNDKYNVMKDYSYLLGENYEGDWTIVITLGNEKEHNTFKKPNFFETRDYDNYIEELMLNRYYKKPNTFKGNDKIDFYINNKPFVFTEDLLNSVNGKSWTFYGDLAKYEVKYSENWGNIIPKSFIVYKNEIFDVSSQVENLSPLITNSSAFMRNLGAINLRDNLSIVVTPLNTKNYLMNHSRDCLNYLNSDKNVTLLHFVEDFKNNLDPALKKLIEDSNKNKNFNSISKELMNELVSNLIENEKNLIGKNKTKKEKDNKVETISEIEEIKDEKVELDLELLDIYPLIRYNLKQKSLELNLNENDLILTLKEYIKFSNKILNKIYKGKLDNIFDNLNIMYIKGNSLLTKGICNVLGDLTTIKSNDINDETKLFKYVDLLKYFFIELKNDITIDNENSMDKIKPLDVDLLSKEVWTKVFKNIETLEENKNKSSLDYIAIYNKVNVSVNIEHKFFKRLEEDFIENYLRKNLVEDIEFIKQGFKDKVVSTMGYLCSYYSMFDFIPEENLILKLDNVQDYINFLSGEHILSSKIELTRILDRELELLIRD